MASVTLQLIGLPDLIAALRQLPPDLAAEGGAIVVAAADQAAEEIVAAYPERTGNLKHGVKRIGDSKGTGAFVRVVNTARHAHLFEFGTQSRQTAIGANRGAMPAGNVFIPIVVRRRRAMVDALVALLQRAGLTVRHAHAA